MIYVECNMFTFYRNILERFMLRTITKVNPVRLLGVLRKWEGKGRMKLLFRAGMIQSTKSCPLICW